MQDIFEHRVEDQQAILPNVPVKLFLSIVGGNWTFYDSKTQDLELNENLRIKMVVVRAQMKRNLLQCLAAEDSKTRVIL